MSRHTGGTLGVGTDAFDSGRVGEIGLNRCDKSSHLLRPFRMGICSEPMHIASISNPSNDSWQMQDATGAPESMWKVDFFQPHRPL